MTIFSLINPKLICIACCPLTGLIHLDPISGTLLLGRNCLNARRPEKNNEALINTDIVLGSIDICKFLVKVIYEGPNFVEPVIFKVTRGRQSVLSLKCIKRLYCCIYAWRWQQRTRAYDESGLWTNTTAIHFLLVMPMLRVRPPKNFKFGNRNRFP
ncbi:unnamed protein product [Staurois parvus]|uniref:Uncharacterized protein n=1 Tax=Staurois parvus TaxID=386267 RepID=A0ABN9AI16_9NEOB|nr:unnamed protein product [Staurois parvus]